MENNTDQKKVKIVKTWKIGVSSATSFQEMKNVPTWKHSPRHSQTDISDIPVIESKRAEISKSFTNDREVKH